MPVTFYGILKKFIIYPWRRMISTICQKRFIRKRVRKTISCKDCEYIPKVSNAGEIISEDNVEYQIMHNGIKIVKGCYHGDWMTSIIKALQGHHEPQQEKVFYEILKLGKIPPNGCMIELGSFWAYYSMWFNKEIENAKNYLIEPIEKNLNIGKENFKANNMTGNFTLGFIGKESKKEAVFENYDKTKIIIPQICIDDFADENNISHINLIHSDIQGAEFDMLLGCEKLISKKKIDFFIISTHNNKIHNLCLNFLKEHNYHIVELHSIMQSVSADGLIVACSNPSLIIENISITK